MEFAKGFKIKRFRPGERVYQTQDKLDSFNIVIRGKMGIFYQDLQKIRECRKYKQARVVVVNEAEANRRNAKRHKLMQTQKTKKYQEKIKHQESLDGGKHCSDYETIKMFQRLLGEKYTGSHAAEENPLFKYMTPEIFN